jgi:hypothetical protein
MQAFKIVSIERVSDGQVKVRVRMDSKAWHAAKRAKQLGSLYGVDISNMAYRMHGVKAHNPSVSDKTRAMGGIKWIDLYYADETWQDATHAANVTHVDFQLRRKISAPVLFKPVPNVPIEGGPLSQREPCEVIDLGAYRFNRKVG